MQIDIVMTMLFGYVAHRTHQQATFKPFPTRRDRRFAVALRARESVDSSRRVQV